MNRLTWRYTPGVILFTFCCKRIGSSFAMSGMVQATGNSSSVINYTFIDKNATPGKNFYPLKQVDLNGAYEYSKLVEVTIGTAATSISVFPNPATSYITINHPFCR